jgi:DNA-binding transcriptional LysR family regulator
MARKGSSSRNDRAFARRIDWNLFKLFAEIVEAGSVSAAARALNRQQPSLSAALKRIEAHFGTALAERTAQGVVLTPAGRAVADIAQAMDALARGAPAEAAKADGAVEGSVALRMVSDLVSPALDAAIHAFHRRHPAVEITLDIAPWRTVVDSVRSGEVDIGVACDDAPLDGLRYEPLVRETQQLYCGLGHPLHGAPPQPARALRGESYVLTGADEPGPLKDFRRRYRLGERSTGFAETLHEVLRLIRLGIGIGFLPVAVRDAYGPDLWPLLPADQLPSYDVYMVTREGGPESLAARRLAEAMSAICAGDAIGRDVP